MRYKIVHTISIESHFEAETTQEKNQKVEQYLKDHNLDPRRDDVWVRKLGDEEEKL